MWEHARARERARAQAPRATDRRAPIENPIYSQGKLRTYKINLLGKNKLRNVLPGNLPNRADSKMKHAPGQPDSCSQGNAKV